MKTLMIQRAPEFSPNSVAKDKAILDAVAERLRFHGSEVVTISEDALDSSTVASASADLVLTMGRRRQTLDMLKELKVRCINRPEGIDNCARSLLQTIMERIGTPMPPKEGADGYWLKRGDAAAQSKDDVVFAGNKEALASAIRQMEQRGISSYTVSAHVVGDLVKFYGVRAAGFFRFFYPTDDGLTKFGDEALNGVARHYAFSVADMQRQTERLAEAVGVEVYGGDCIVRADGTFCVIDFNDWPSFSRCREDAADAIASLIK